MRKHFALLTLLALWAAPALAMDGIVTDTGDAVTVTDGTTFTEGDVVPVFDADGNEQDMEVMSVTDAADSVTVDFADQDSGDAKTIEFFK